MKHLSFKVLIFCILMPPLLYLLTSNLLQSYLTRWYETDIKNVYLSDIDDVLNGSTPLAEAIQTSIDTYRRKSTFTDLGGRIEVTVTTSEGNILYPPAYKEDTLSELPSDPVKLAEQNFKTLEQGLNLDVRADIPPYALISLAILMGYILLFLGLLYGYYRKALRSVRADDAQKADEIRRLEALEKSHKERAQSLADERESLLSEYQEIQASLEETKQKAEKEEEELFEEIERLEGKLSENLSLQNEQDLEISQLKERLQELEKTRQARNHQREKAAERLGKRFKVLYKNIDITDRALSGLAEMDDDMSLKAEELIHQLNEDPSLVTVKRKVFSKKGRATVFEAVFAYKGRLYFRKNSQNRGEVLAIGTKKSQSKDLAYLDTL